MARYDFRETASIFERFAAELFSVEVRFELDSNSQTALIVLRARPNVEYDSDDFVDVKIRAIDPYRCEARFQNLNLGFIDIGIDFETKGPKLWSYENQAEIFCNSQVNLEVLFRKVVSRMNGQATANDISKYLTRVHCYNPPFWLGRFPESLFYVVRSALVELGVAIFCTEDPKPSDLPVLLEIDDFISIIAKDFEVELPDPINIPSWFDR
jgi:hypothetical protein